MEIAQCVQMMPRAIRAVGEALRAFHQPAEESRAAAFGQEQADPFFSSYPI